MTTNVTLNVNENSLRTFASLVANSLTTEVTNRQTNDLLLDTKIESLKERLESLNTNYALANDSGNITGLISGITQINGLVSITTSNIVDTLTINTLTVGTKITVGAAVPEVPDSFTNYEYMHKKPTVILVNQTCASTLTSAKNYTDTQITNLFTYSNGILTINI